MSRSRRKDDAPRNAAGKRTRLWLLILPLLVLLGAEAVTRYRLLKMRSASPPPNNQLEEKCATALASLDVVPEYDTDPDPALDRDLKVWVKPGRDYRGSLEDYARAERSLWDELHWAYHPNSRLLADFAGTKQSVRINSHGCRSAEFSAEKPDGVFRIICIGGSTTVAGETNNTTYPALLQHQLRRLLGTDHIEVINTGVYGLTSAGEREKLPTFLSWQPDLIVESNGVNDIYYLILRDYREAMPLWKRTLGRSAFFAWCFPQLFRPSPDEMAAEIEQHTIRNLESIHDQASARDVDVVLLSFAYPTPELLKPEERKYLDDNARGSWFRDVDYQTYTEYAEIYNEKLIRAAQEKGWRVIPIHQRLLGGCDMFWDICHATVVGRVEKVKYIADAIRDDVAAGLARP